MIVLVSLVARASEAHMHFCLDGHEAFSAFHVADQGPDCDNDGSGTQKDLDVDITGDSLAKPNFDAHFFSAPPLSFDLLLIVPPTLSSPEPTEVASHPPAKHPYLLRPPLRGPPA